MALTRKPTPGFQASETTGAEVTFYPQEGDPIVVSSEVVRPQGRFSFDTQPSLVAVSTQKALGAPAGQWSVTLKPGRRAIAKSLFTDLIDDDWVDISFFRHNKRWHVMRGLVGDTGRSRTVGGTGATSETWTISGTEFGSIWERTPIWFNPFMAENLGGGISQKVFTGAENILGDPAQAVEAFLFLMLVELDNLGRANWVIPKGMRTTSQKFIQSVVFDQNSFQNEPPLIGVGQSWLMPQGTLWQLAKEWSDPLFNELIPDSRRRDTFFEDISENELRVNDSQMVAMFRRRPFPETETAQDGPWFQLPIFIIPREAVVANQVNRSGAERYNAFFVSPKLIQDIVSSGGIDLAQPLWNEDDISRHGLRRFDVVSKYTSPRADLLGVSREYRRLVRDWYCLNPYFLSGTLQLATGIPAIRVGVRARIPGARSNTEDETYYVEQVSHNWQFGQGLRTSLGVTRGWVGTDDSLMAAIYRMVSRYSSPGKVEPTEFDGSSVLT